MSIPISATEITLLKFINNDKPYTLVQGVYESNANDGELFRLVKPPPESNSIKMIENLSDEYELRIESRPFSVCTPKSVILKRKASEPMKNCFCEHCGWAIVSQHTDDKRNELEFRAAIIEAEEIFEGHNIHSPRGPTLAQDHSAAVQGYDYDGDDERERIESLAGPQHEIESLAGSEHEIESISRSWNADHQIHQVYDTDKSESLGSSSPHSGYYTTLGTPAPTTDSVSSYQHVLFEKETPEGSLSGSRLLASTVRWF
ncbi:hypothetical protein PCANC_07288 [Puccinia coronata f. sp. avenae]|uniref:Uncharacterized protein n=1 Tax=Puccinia coronata f. sp. avenae TaxID=200324 RepID=A0A2N5SZ37_9BASI|nr:hypothetical protein PCANC_12291 [Puccinia coronata f. sp. avenae]PLW52762.1 hypothetical protein PCANC_07288 [Puccinia coronata f. sp. avenae]